LVGHEIRERNKPGEDYDGGKRRNGVTRAAHEGKGGGCPPGKEQSKRGRGSYAGPDRVQARDLGFHNGKTSKDGGGGGKGRMGRTHSETLKKKKMVKLVTPHLR